MTSLRILRPFDPWRSPLCTCPPKYSLHPYTGCSFKCLYCYATAYIGVRDSTPKRNVLRNLLRDLSKLPRDILINMSTSSDPYPPIEDSLKLTRSILRILTDLGRRVLITTKGSLVARDADILGKGNAAVMMTITTLDDSMARVIEPGAPRPRDRIEALRILSSRGIPVGVRVDPIIPYINDDPHEIRRLLARIRDVGAKFIVTSTYKARPDNLARMRDGLGELGEKIYRLYKSYGERVHGYLYLPRAMRIKLLTPVIEAARELGLEYALCREGLRGSEWFRSGSCDGSHLIPRRVEPKPLGVNIDRWLDSQS